jgi:hypothetical protein
MRCMCGNSSFSIWGISRNISVLFGVRKPIRSRIPKESPFKIKLNLVKATR